MSAGEPLVNDYGLPLHVHFAMHETPDYPGFDHVAGTEPDKCVACRVNEPVVACCPICDAPLSGHRRESPTPTQKAGWQFAQRAYDKQHPFRALWRRLRGWLR